MLWMNAASHELRLQIIASKIESKLRYKQLKSRKDLQDDLKHGEDVDNDTTQPDVDQTDDAENWTPVTCHYRARFQKIRILTKIEYYVIINENRTKSEFLFVLKRW